MTEIKTRNSTYRRHGEQVMQVCGTPMRQLPAGEWVEAEITGITVGCRMLISVGDETLTTSPVTSIAEIDS